MPTSRVLRAALERLTKAQWRRVAETVAESPSDGELLIMRDALYDEVVRGTVESPKEERNG